MSHSYWSGTRVFPHRSGGSKFIGNLPFLPVFNCPFCGYGNAVIVVSVSKFSVQKMAQDEWDLVRTPIPEMDRHRGKILASPGQHFFARGGLI